MRERQIAEGALGVGARPAHFHDLFAAPPDRPAWLEVTSENYFGVGGAPRRLLERVRAQRPVALHGVGLSIGSVDALSPTYLAALAALVKELAPPFVSDHLCWTRHRGKNTHDLMPVPYTSSMLERIVDRLGLVQDKLGRRFYLENPSAYVGFRISTMAEHEFLAELVRRSGCGILLDVNNLYVNKQNHGAGYPDPSEYLAAFSAGDLCYFHLAGHTVCERDGVTVRVDTHDRAVPDDVWTLYRSAVARFPSVPTLVEWDGDLPPFATLMAQVDRAAHERAAALEVRPAAATPVVATRGPRDGATALATDAALARFADAVYLELQVKHTAAAADWLTDDGSVPAALGLGVYQDAYVLRFVDVAGSVFAGTKQVLGAAVFSRIVEEHVRRNAPTRTDVVLAVAELPATLDAASVPELTGVSQRAVADLARLEWAYADLYAAPDEPSAVGPGSLQEIAPDEWEAARFDLLRAARVLACEYDVVPTFEAVRAKTEPARPTKRACQVLVARPDLPPRDGGERDPMPQLRVLAPGEAAAWTTLASGGGVADACAAVARELGQEGGDVEAHVGAVVGWLARWAGDGLLRGIRIAQA